MQIIKQELQFEEKLNQRIKFICEFDNLCKKNMLLIKLFYDINIWKIDVSIDIQI